nr:MAG TPA: hypothetical protein [Caudoviricetes sp.]
MSRPNKSLPTYSSRFSLNPRIIKSKKHLTLYGMTL